MFQVAPWQHTAWPPGATRVLFSKGGVMSRDEMRGVCLFCWLCRVPPKGFMDINVTSEEGESKAVHYSCSAVVFCAQLFELSSRIFSGGTAKQHSGPPLGPLFMPIFALFPWRILRGSSLPPTDVSALAHIRLVVYCPFCLSSIVFCDYSSLCSQLYMTLKGPQTASKQNDDVRWWILISNRSWRI